MKDHPGPQEPPLITVVEPGKLGGPKKAPEVAFEAFGVDVVITTNEAALLDRIRPMLPPGWRENPVTDDHKRFTLLADNKGTYGVAKDGKGMARGVPLDLALDLLESQVRVHIGEHSPAAIFVHAGVVGHAGKALVLPGISFAGKTTLVAELVRAGATYYSDEFALVGDDGLIRPYPKPLSIRGADLAQTDHHVSTIGGTVGVEPLPAGAVVITHYKPGAAWSPRTLSAGNGVLALLENTVPAQSRPTESMHALTRAVAGATILEGDRGEAAAIVPQLLAELER